MNEKYLKYSIHLSDATTWIVVTPDLAKNHINMYVQELGDFFLTGRHYTERNGLDSFQICYFLYGEMQLSFRGKEYLIKPGDTMWIDCRDHYIVKGDCDSNCLFVHYDSNIASYYFEQFYALNKNSPLIQMSDSFFIDGSIRKLIEIYRNGSSLEADFRGVEIIISLMTRMVLEVFPKSGDEQLGEHVAGTLRYIREHYTKKITLDMLAGSVHLSKFHLSRLFSQAMGVTPNEYLIRFRINKAKELLRQTNYSIAEICEKIGVDNASYFIKLFRRYENIPPGGYRKKWGGNQRHE